MLYLKENLSATDYSSLAESDSDNLIWSNSKYVTPITDEHRSFFFNKTVVRNKYLATKYDILARKLVLI